MNPVALGLVAAGNPIDFERHDGAIIQTDNPLQWAHPAHLAPAGPHGLRPMKIAHQVRHQLSHDVRRRAARNGARRDIKIAFFRIRAYFCLIN